MDADCIDRRCSLLAYLQIVLGELCPKSLAMLYSEQLARFLGSSVKAIVRFFSPFIWILNQSTRCLLKSVGVEYTGQSWKPPVTPEELQLIISTERESTGLLAGERELLNNIFEFGEVTVQAIMVPRSGIVTVPIHVNLQIFLQTMADTGHSCYPIMGESLDDIHGILHFQDLAKFLASEKLQMKTEIKKWMRPVRFVPENTLLKDLLPTMQQAKPTMVIVVDEFGGTSGLVTIQDVIAQIIGETGEADSTDEVFKLLNEQTFLVQAQINLEELNEILHINLPQRDGYQTLGGFLLYQLQKIPSVGEICQYQNIEFTVISLDGPRLHQIQIQYLGEKCMR